MKFAQFREESYAEQVSAAREIRTREIRSMADKIVEGKRRKLAQASRKKQEWRQKRNEEAADEEEEEELIVDADKVIQDEIDKIKDFPPQNLLIQTYNGEPKTSIQLLRLYFCVQQLAWVFRASCTSSNSFIHFSTNATNDQKCFLFPWQIFPFPEFCPEDHF